MNNARRDDEWLATNRPEKAPFCPAAPGANPVDHPSHYTHGRRFEVIEVLEEWASRAPDPVLGGLLWQALKYQGRLFDKANALEDAKKARWYLNRLIDKLEEESTPSFAGNYQGPLYAPHPDLHKDLEQFKDEEVYTTYTDGSAIYGVRKNAPDVRLGSVNYDDVLMSFLEYPGFPAPEEDYIGQSEWA